MPRSGGRSGGGRSAAPARAPARPVAAPQRPAVPTQTRPASTAAHGPGAQQAPPQQSQGSGLFGQMASTAAGVAVGSSIGHAIGGFFGGGGSSAAASDAPIPEQQQVNAAAQDPQAWGNAGNFQQQYGAGGACDVDVRNFAGCMSDNKGDLQICGWYLEQLKSCQQAARNY